MDAAAPEYTVHYFPLYVRGEAIRMLLTHAAIPFTDHVIGWDEWKDQRKLMPGGQVPVLEFNKDGGQKVGQSHAILRFLGAKYGYYPSDSRTALTCDSWLCAYEDILG